MKKRKPDQQQSQENGKNQSRSSEESDFPQELDQGKDNLVPLKKGILDDTDWIQEVKEKIHKKKES